jgi:nitrous oxide reductase accessory protein NosL
MNYDRNTTGLVRHLKVYQNPKWVSKIKTRAGKDIFFSSPKSMFEFYYQPGKWYDIGVRSERDFYEIVVTDYSTAKPIDAEKAFYVYGSSMTSPSGDDLPAFATKSSAEKFAKKFNGKRVMSFKSVSSALIGLLNGSI